MLAPVRALGVSRKEAEETARGLLERVKILEQADKYPAQLPAASSSVSPSPAPVHAAERHAVRRADIGARSGDGQGGARHHDRSREEGIMTMICVTHEMGFVSSGGGPGHLYGRRGIVEEAPPQEFFTRPRHERTRKFLGEILSH